MVIITNKEGAGPKEDWVVVEKKDGQFQPPPGYQIIQMDESNFGEYIDRVRISFTFAIVGLFVSLKNLTLLIIPINSPLHSVACIKGTINIEGERTKLTQIKILHKI